MTEDQPAPDRRATGRAALVIGGGLGGLSAAIQLGAAGWSVTLLEAADQLGGKAGTVTLPGGVVADTGPSVLTLPSVLTPLLEAAGLQPGVDLVFRQPEPAFRYRFVDGTVVDLHHGMDETLASVAQALGDDAADEFRRFVAYTGQIWDAAAPRFIYGPAPDWRTVLSYGLGALFELRHIDPLRSMQRAIRAQVRSEHLRMIFARYATYNGSDVRRAPATLNCIAHVELALGGYGIEGGIHAMIEVLAEAARRVGVQVRCAAAVERVELDDRGRVRGVRLRSGEALSADVVVCNADAAWLAEALPAGTRHGLGGSTAVGSMSGWNAILKARRRPDRPAHEVLFCADYDQEFGDIFDHDRPPEDPTIYLCAQERAHGRSGWADHEPLFIMVNAPVEPIDGARPAAIWEAVERTARERLRAHGLTDGDDAVVWRRTPADLAARFPGSLGGLYGAASNDPLAAFRRPPNRLRAVPGLYLATGSAHPGGGMPLALRSGQAAAEAIAADRPTLALPSPEPT